MTTDKMLIDAAHPEETRVVVLRGNRIEEFDFESAAKKLLRGNIYLAKITRVEPSLQAAFVDYGGNRHGFLAFSEIHPDYYQIPVADRQALLREEAEAVAEEARREANEPYHANEADTGGDDAEGQDPGATEVEEAGGGSVPWDVEDNGSGAAPDNDPDAQTLGRRDPTIHSVVAVADLVHQSEQQARELQPALDRSEPSDRFEPTEPMVIDNGRSAHDPIDHTGGLASSEGMTGPEGHASTGSPLSDGPIPQSSESSIAETVEEAVEESPERRRRPRRAQYKIQEVIKRRQIILVQVVKEERGNKGAALTTYLSLAGRYTVLMPNTARGGGISRKITNAVDRRRLKEITSELEVPEGMGLIVRTAGASRTTAEIKRDHDYLLRLWESIRDLTLKSTAPALVYEEGSLVKRSIRDLYSKEIDEVVVAGRESYESARDFMRMLMPSHAKNVKLYDDAEPLFARYQIERQLNAMYSPYVTLKSGGYIVLNQTEALVAIDVNSGKSTREHSIEDTALNTNLEASDEIARQLRLRDLAGLIVIDFIDMDERRNNRSVERRLKEALRFDRARIQVGRISHFGLMEMSRQRLRTGVLEGSTSQCPHCMGTGVIRSTESVALAVLRALEDNLMGNPPRNLVATTSIETALYLLNEKRPYLRDIEGRYGIVIEVDADAQLQGANFRIDATGAASGTVVAKPRHAVQLESGFEAEVEDEEPVAGVEQIEEVEEAAGEADEQGERKRSRRRRRRSGSSSRGERGDRPVSGSNGDGNANGGDEEHPVSAEPGEHITAIADDDGDDGDGESETGQAEGEDGANAAEGDRGERRGRRRGRRGGRRNRRGGRENGERGDQPLHGQAPANGPEPFAVGAEQPEVRGGAWDQGSPEPARHDETSSGSPAEVTAVSEVQASREVSSSAQEANGHAAIAPAPERAPDQGSGRTVPARSMPAPQPEPKTFEDAANAVGSVFRNVYGAEPAAEPASKADIRQPEPAVESQPPPATLEVSAEPAGPPKRGWWTKRFSGG